MSDRADDASLDRQEKLRRDTEEWRAQARELERLRAEVRGSAQREAEAIIERVRADVAEIVQRARAELTVLRAQVRAVGAEERAALPEPAGAAATTSAHEASSLPDLSGFDDLDADADVGANETAPDPEVPRRMHGFFAEAQEPVRAAFPATWPGEEPEPRGRSMKVVILLALLAAGAIALVWWAQQQRQAASSEPAAGAAAEVARPSAAERSTSPEVPASQTSAPPAGSSPGATAAPAEAPAAAAAPARYEVVFETTRDVWLRVNVDGAPDGGRIVPAGERIVVSPERQVTVRAGNAGAVRVSVGGGAAVPFGVEGQPATRTFERRQE